ARELDDDASLHALAAEAVRLGLDVVDVDHRDAGVRVRLAVRDRDVHRTAGERRPALVEVHERLVEAEQALVEVAPAIEIGHLVDDARLLSHAQRASAGSSTKDLTVRRKSAASAPSTARWSTVSVIVISGRGVIAPSLTTGCSVVAPTARIAACGGLSTGGNFSISQKPRVGIVKKHGPKVAAGR